MSIREVAEQLGISYTGARNILIRNNETRKSIGRSEKYPKTDFSGEPAEQARMQGFIEDCGAAPHRRQICVSTTTTHPAQIKLFDDDLFGKYGHANRALIYNELHSYYEWHVQILLNPTFEFLIDYKENPMRFLTDITENGYIYDYTVGFAEAEGWVGIEASDGRRRAALTLYNKNRQILEWIEGILGGSIGLGKHAYQLMLRGEAAIEALRKLPVTHEEKAAARELILRHADNGGIGLEALREYRELRRRIDDEVQLCTMQARLEWIRRHGKPHPKDPDQPISPN